MRTEEIVKMVNDQGWEAVVSKDEEPNTDEVKITTHGKTWFVWNNPEWTEVQCYDLPDGGYDGVYVKDIAYLFIRMLKDIFEI